MPQYEKATKKSIRTKNPMDLIGGRLQVNDMEISDEYVTAEKGSSGQQLAKMLLENEGDALLIKEGDRIVGIVTEHSLLKAIADGKVKVELPASDLMTGDIMEVKATDALEDILPVMYEKQPTAVVVTDEGGNFVGYFSPNDCKLASIKLNFYEE